MKRASKSREWRPAQAHKTGAHQLGKGRRWGGLPDRIERGLDLGESAGRGQQQSAYTDDRGKYPSTLMAGALNHRLQDFGALLADQFAELADDRALGGIEPEVVVLGG